MNILALDLGTKTGYAIFCDGQIKTSGTKKLSKKTFGSRFSEFRCWLIETICKNQIDVVCFERVYRHAGTEAAHVYGGFMYTLAAVCDELSVSCEGFSVGSIKKFMTGKGNASKVDVIEAAKRRGFDPIDDNEADALGVLFLGLNYINESCDTLPSRVLPSPGRERVPSPRDLASVRKFSLTLQYNSEELIMQIQNISIDKLVEYARNPRKNDGVVDKMTSCIKEFGFRIPIVAKSDGTIVDGHLRLKAARKMGLKEVPVVNADDLTEAQIKAFRLVANQSANWAEWDEELLKLEFKELEDLDFDLELTGFDLDDIQRRLDELEAGEIVEDDLDESEMMAD